jgi:P27 family predicted phage terminase small subunit
MTRGRTPTPANVLKLRGTHRADRHGARMVTECAEPDCPTMIRGRAAAVWARTVPLLVQARAISRIDADALARYCVAQAAWEKLVDRLGRCRNAKDFDAIAKVMRGLSATANRLAGELGLTPASRGRVRAAAPEEPEHGKANGKARFFGA